VDLSIHQSENATLRKYLHPKYNEMDRKQHTKQCEDVQIYCKTIHRIKFKQEDVQENKQGHRNASQEHFPTDGTKPMIKL